MADLSIDLPIKRAAYDELEALLEKHGYQGQRIAIVSNMLWVRLAEETRDPFQAAGSERPVTLWYKNWTMILPVGRCLILDQAKEVASP